MSNFQFFKEEQKKMKRYAIEAEEEKSIKGELLRNLHYFGRYTL